MRDKHKGMVNGHGRSVRREQMVPVAPESRQGKAPDSGPGNRQSGAASGSMSGDAHRRRRKLAGGVSPPIKWLAIR